MVKITGKYHGEFGGKPLFTVTLIEIDPTTRKALDDNGLYIRPMFLGITNSEPVFVGVPQRIP
jgi:hypothetical protein